MQSGSWLNRLFNTKTSEQLKQEAKISARLAMLDDDAETKKSPRSETERAYHYMEQLAIAREDIYTRQSEYNELRKQYVSYSDLASKRMELIAQTRSAGVEPEEFRKINSAVESIEEQAKKHPTVTPLIEEARNLRELKETEEQLIEINNQLTAIEGQLQKAKTDWNFRNIERQANEATLRSIASKVKEQKSKNVEEHRIARYEAEMKVVPQQKRERLEESMQTLAITMMNLEKQKAALLKEQKAFIEKKQSLIEKKQNLETQLSEGSSYTPPTPSSPSTTPSP